jgi:hypothetical protein
LGSSAVKPTQKHESKRVMDYVNAATKQTSSKINAKSLESCETESDTDEDANDDEMKTGDVQLDACSNDQDSNDCNDSNSIKIVPKKKVAAGCKQVYDKSNYCKFCGKMIISKIARHLLTHYDETEIQDIHLLPARHPQRMARLHLLANNGNSKHNTSAIAAGRGHVVRRSKSSHVDPNKYLLCEFCHKFLSKNNLWRHLRTCSVRNGTPRQEAHSGDQGGDNSRVKQSAVFRGRWLLNSAVYQSSEKCLADMMIRMRDDRLKQVVMKDKLIRHYAIRHLQSLGSKKVQKHNDIYCVSQSARLMARVTEDARKKTLIWLLMT